MRQDAEGRYNLNDLHQAAEAMGGGKADKRPHKFLGSADVTDFIEVLKGENSSLLPVTVQRGRNGGTYVVKELVYRYAAWVSKPFEVKVYRAYDALVTGKLQTPSDPQAHLNDLHRASGGEPKKAPSQWMRNKQFKELASELENCADLHSLPVRQFEGRNGGTFVVEELIGVLSNAQTLGITPRERTTCERQRDRRGFSELIQEIQNTQNLGVLPVDSVRDRNGGTFVTKELMGF